MSYFDTTNGSGNIEIIARSLVRIAKALEENNRLMAEALDAGESGKHIAPQSSAAKKDYEEIG